MKSNDEILKVEFDKNKPEFEILIKDSVKETNISNCYNKLLKAYNKLPNYIEKIKHSQKKVYILNFSILEKIDRLIQRNYININILLSKILYIILNASNLEILSDESRDLIYLANISINILELISSYDLYQSLIKRISTFLNFLKNNSEKYLNDEQYDIINNLHINLGEKIYSNEYISFGNNYQKEIIIYLSKESLNEKEKGITNLNNYFFRLKTLNEQFDLLCLYGYLILNAIMNKQNPCYIELYYKMADFMISFVYNFYYIIKLEKNMNNDFNINNFYISDNMDINNILNKNDIQLEKYENYNNPNNLNFLIDKKFELDEQKSFLLNYTNIFSLSSTLVSYLMIYESSFNCQYISYLILKRLYFIFPQFRDQIEDLISIILINLITFKKDQIKIENNSYIFFLKYLLIKGEKRLKDKLQTRLNAQNLDENTSKEINDKNIDNINIEYENIFLNEYNLRIGCPMNIEILAGYTEEKIIEINYPNSIIFISFNTVGMNITFRLLKFCPLVNEEGDKHFYEIFNIEKTEGSKIILTVKNPGIYKIVFDNKYSWFNAKTIRYRINIMKEMNDNIDNINNNNDNVNINENNSIIKEEKIEII